MEKITAYGYYFTGAGKPLEKQSLTIEECGEGEAVVKVAGCGLCHTDLGFISGSVNTNHALPLILGHEISGTVVAGGANCQSLVGKKVIVPAVLPCGECELCKGGRGNVCRKQVMPGNDFNGGFASYVKVPGRFLCQLPNELGKFKLNQLAVVADAMTTPYQSLKKSKLKKGDLAIVIGVGGIGIYMVQLAKNVGATVIAMDIDDAKLERAKTQGADFTINSKELSEKDLKNSIRGMVKENKLPSHQWKVFEMSGTAAGQTTAFSLLSFAGTLGVVGFTMEKVTLRLSNIMAFDADVFGNWGCLPEYYPEVADKVLKGELNLLDNIEERPLDAINETLKEAFEHKLTKRVIFTP
ncbi:MAG: galactitol-1-phosphate 5-dehydrogenase [Myxococcota bacterium]